MKLLTEELRKALPALYGQDEKMDPMVYCKFFAPWTDWTWYVTEFDGVDEFFGYVDGFHGELGYFSLAELSKTRGPGGLGIERDMHFKPCLLSKVLGVKEEKP